MVIRSPGLAHALGIARVRRLAASGEARQRRIANRVSQAELAKDIGTSQAALSLWERGLRRPTGDTALAWLDVLDEWERQ